MLAWLSLSLAASATWVAILFLSDRGTRRIWPPERGNWPTAIWAWALTTAIYVGLINTATADWNSLGWPGWLRWGLGGAGLTLISFWIQGRGIVDLGLAGTSGWDTGLVAGGAYARRRHPQYAGQIVSLVGLAILGASSAAILAAGAGCAALFYASLVEDRDLARRYGADHARYRQTVRFLF